MVSGELLDKAAELLAKARRLAIFTGAGVSKESGVPTYQETLTGKWAEFDPVVLSSIDTFRRDPETVWGFYQDVLLRHGSIRPNAAHIAFAEMEKLFEKVVIITQNIDGLHHDAGSTDILELHGSLRRYRCLNGLHTGLQWDELVMREGSAVPLCPHCGDTARPEIVCFGEMLPPDVLERSFSEAGLCDAMLVVGTRAEVQPAARIPYEAIAAGSPVVEVNVSPSALTPHVTLFIEGRAGEVAPGIVDRLRERLA